MFKYVTALIPGFHYDVTSLTHLVTKLSVLTEPMVKHQSQPYG